MNIDHLYKRLPWVWESHLVNRLGINRDELRQLRNTILLQGADWRLEKNRVEISLAGAAKLAAHLELVPAVQTAGEAEEKNGAEAQPQEALEATLCVWRTFPKNRHIIEGFKPGADPTKRENVLRIKVKDSTRFTRFTHLGKPMELKCRHLQADFWEHIGPMPKKKGRA